LNGHVYTSMLKSNE